MAKRFLDQRWPWLAAAALIVLAFVVSTLLELRDAEDPRPVGSAQDVVALKDRNVNLLFILIDTLRADRLGAYGYERDTSPTLDRLAARGVRFAHHLSQSSWTKASMASMWSSLIPSRTGITRFDQVLPDEARMPAEVLKEAGFRTVGIYRNGWVAPTFGFEQGFDVYMRPVPLARLREVVIKNPTVAQKSTDEDAVAAALEFLRIHGGDRWFLYLHLMDVHEYLYDEESALFGGTYADIYDNSIRWTDTTLGLLLEHLANQGRLTDTLIVIAADHGEAFRERGLEGHARGLFRETTEVPFLISFPFRIEPGAVVDARTRNVDVWPTLFDLLGLDPPADSDGRSLVPDLLASLEAKAPPEVDRTGIAQLDQNWGQRGRKPQPTVAVVDGTFRYVRQLEAGREVERLFDRAADPAELHSVAANHPEELERLRGLAEASMAKKPPWGDVPTRDIDELELNQLRALGYAIP